MKDVRDARAIRSRILECKTCFFWFRLYHAYILDTVPGFEQANQPTLSDTERRQLLNFVIVGAGPTGVEFAAELHDLLHAEIWEHYPSLAKMARINLYDVAPSILGMFDSNLVQ